MSQSADFTLVTNKDIRTQLTHHIGRHWMVDKLTVSDVEDMRPFIPDFTAQVVDLCCGTGRNSIAMHQLCLPDAKFWLVDGNVNTEVENIERHWGKYTNDGIARFYNKRELTKECCRLNDFNNCVYIEVDENLQWSKLPRNVDFLFSNRGIGCHWPMSVYTSVFPQILRDGAICMFMNRILGDIPEYFSQVATLRDSIQDNPLIVFRYNKIE